MITLLLFLLPILPVLPTCPLVFLPAPGGTDSQRPWGVYVASSSLADAPLVTPGTTVYQAVAERDGQLEFLFHLRETGWVIGSILSVETGAEIKNVSGTVEPDLMDCGTWASGVRAWCLEEGGQCRLAGRDTQDPAIRDQFEVFEYGKPSVNRPGVQISWSFAEDVKSVQHFELEVTTAVVQFSSNDRFMSMGGFPFFGGLQSDDKGEGNMALFSTWTVGGSGEVRYLNRNWGFEGRCEESCSDGSCSMFPGCETISHSYKWSLGQQVLRTKVIGILVSDDGWDLERTWDLEGWLTHPEVLSPCTG